VINANAPRAELEGRGGRSARRGPASKGAPIAVDVTTMRPQAGCSPPVRNPTSSSTMRGPGPARRPSGLGKRDDWDQGDPDGQQMKPIGSFIKASVRRHDDSAALAACVNITLELGEARPSTSWAWSNGPRASGLNRLRGRGVARRSRCAHGVTFNGPAARPSGHRTGCAAPTRCRARPPRAGPSATRGYKGAGAPSSIRRPLRTPDEFGAPGLRPFCADAPRLTSPGRKHA